MNIKFSSILLFTLIIPYIMTVRLSPGETPYWLFGLIFLGILIYSLNILNKLKETIFWFLIFAVIGSSFASSMIVRHESHPTYQIHDMPLQQEIAIRFLLEGKNPYSESYFGTFLEEWHYSDKEKNPALYHFVLLPFYIIFALPFYFLGNTFFGFFDARMPLIFLFMLLLFTAWKLPIEKEKKRIFITLLAFNPATLPYLLEGRSDIFMYAFLFLGFFLLHKQKHMLAGIPMALAFAVKQSVWPILPFYIAFLYFRSTSQEPLGHLRGVMKLLVPFILTFSAVILPFILWDIKAFLDSTIFYLSGTLPTSYPISGYGFGMLLGVNDYYPFQIWQLIIGLPVFIMLIRYLKKAPNVKRLIFTYGIFLFVFWYFSRYFNNSHVGYLTMVFITAYFWPSSANASEGKPENED